MRLKLIAFFCMALLTCSAFASCGEKKNNSESADKPVETKLGNVDPDGALKEDFKSVEELTEGPVLKLNNVTAKAGETAEVTISVTNADYQWNMCGLHIVYPKELKCTFENEEKRLVEYDLGSASKHSNGSTAMYWRDNQTEYMTSNNLDSVFFTEIFSDDSGMDGDIVTFYFQIPADAKSGTVYPIDFMYVDSDTFSNAKNEANFSKYAFEHWEGGSVTVE